VDGGGEEIELGRDARVAVVDVRAEKVLLGFALPKNLQLHRQEIYDVIHAERRRGWDLM
jgi:carbon storage regulator CsrA